MRYRFFGILALGTCLVGMGGTAQSAKACDTQGTCENASSTLEAQLCISKLLDEEDTQLNEAYQDLLAAIDASGYNDPGKIKDRLVNSQRNWISYRDDYCDFRHSSAEGGSIGGLFRLDCLCTLTRDKKEHLQDDLELF